MKPKIYSSFEQLDNDIEVLKVDPEIHYQKIILHAQRSKENLSTRILLFGVLNVNIPKSSSKILKFISPIFLQWFFNKKRGS